MMDAAQKPSAPHFVLNVIDTFPGGLRTGAVAHPKKKSRDELDREREDERAAPRVAPARAAGDGLEEHGVEHAAIAGAMVEPVPKGLCHVRGILSAVPAAKFWKRTCTSPVL